MDMEEFGTFGCGCLLAAGALGGLLVLSTCAGIISLPFAAVNNTVTVAHRIMDPDNALTQYRYFHDANARLEVFPAQIKEADDNLKYAEAHTPDYVASRMTELTGIKQVCQNLVADYNSRAQRLDSGFFRNPERFLPISAAPWQPLPQGYDPSYCEGEKK